MAGVLNRWKSVEANLIVEVAMTNHLELEPCITCDNPDCGATMILSSPAAIIKNFNLAADYLDLQCPACNRIFSASIFKFQWVEVQRYDFTKGYLGCDTHKLSWCRQELKRRVGWKPRNPLAEES
jgi:hypothetical protein